MSGHSKWSQIKRQKGVTDKQRGQVFTKLGRAITIAVREGGGVADPELNFKLRLAVEKARQANMPKTNIERAIASGVGAGGGEGWESLMYEGYGPSGIAVMVETVTNNRNRTLSEIKQVFDRGGGIVGQIGAVGYLFDRLGLILIKIFTDKEKTVLAIMNLEGVIDVEFDEEEIAVWTEPERLKEVEEQLRVQDVDTVSAELTMRPKIMRQLESGDKIKVEAFIERVEELDDVQQVWSDMEI